MTPPSPPVSHAYTQLTGEATLTSASASADTLTIVNSDDAYTGNLVEGTIDSTVTNGNFLVFQQAGGGVQLTVDHAGVVTAAGDVSSSGSLIASTGADITGGIQVKTVGVDIDLGGLNIDDGGITSTGTTAVCRHSHTSVCVCVCMCVHVCVYVCPCVWV